MRRLKEFCSSGKDDPTRDSRGLRPSIPSYFHLPDITPLAIGPIIAHKYPKAIQPQFCGDIPHPHVIEIIDTGTMDTARRTTKITFSTVILSFPPQLPPIGKSKSCVNIIIIFPVLKTFSFIYLIYYIHHIFKCGRTGG